MDYDSYDVDLYHDSDDEPIVDFSQRNKVPFEISQEDEYFNTISDGQSSNTDPEDMEEFGQVYLAKLKSLREQFNWKNEEERYPFYLRLSNLMRSWRGNLPNLQDIFRAEEIDYFLSEAVMNRKRAYENYRGRFFVEFVYNNGYRDKPELNEDGKPPSRRTTAVHRTKDAEDDREICEIIYDLFKIYNRFDVNYTDESGYTHFHAACRTRNYDVIKEFLELGQDPNCLWTETGDSPLHLALAIHHYNKNTKQTIKLLLRSGADPSLPNKEGLTPLHIICNVCTGARFMEEFFEIIDANHQTIQIDAKDNLGRTPLQLAVANLRTDMVGVLLDRGADLSSFVFPTESYFGEMLERDIYTDKSLTSNLYLVHEVLTLVESLEERGYELDRSDALTIMKFFDKRGLFKTLVDLDEFLHGKEKFVRVAKKIMFIPSLSFYDLIHLPPKEVEKVITDDNLCEFWKSNYFFLLKKRRNHACTTHLSEIIARRFLRRWAQEPLLELTRHYRLPLLCCDIIIKKLTNQDLMNICFAVADQSKDLRTKVRT